VLNFSLGVIDWFWPEISKKFNAIINRSLVVMVIVLLGTGFFLSSWIEDRVESGYVYCRNASGISSLAKTLVYAKDKDICEAIVEPKRRRP
jgi:hypothetical protein